MESETCSICYSDIVNPCKLECGHSFCQQCIVTWFRHGKSECAYCRHNPYKKYNTDNDDYSYHEESTYDDCVDLVRNNLKDNYKADIKEYNKLYKDMLKWEKSVRLHTKLIGDLTDDYFQDLIKKLINETTIVSSYKEAFKKLNNKRWEIIRKGKKQLYNDLNIKTDIEFKNNFYSVPNYSVYNYEATDIYKGLTRRTIKEPRKLRKVHCNIKAKI